MDGNRPDTRPWSPSTSTECPVGVAEQAWIEASMHWFAGQFGTETVLRDVVLPTSDLFPDADIGTPEQIGAMVARIHDLMSVDPSQQLLVRLFGDSGDEAAEKSRRTVGHYHTENGRAVIGLDRREASDPAILVAIIAHELCHVRLLGENRITAARKDHERLTDLLTIYLGFGIFTTNAALSFSEDPRGWSIQPRGDMSERILKARLPQRAGVRLRPGVLLPAARRDNPFLDDLPRPGPANLPESGLGLSRTQRTERRIPNTPDA
jgi:hypothetical protein